MNKNYFLIACFSLLLLSANSSKAQNTTYPLGISFKALFMDYQTVNGGNFTRFNDYHPGFEIGFSKNIQENININVPIKIGVVNDDSYDLDKFDQGRTLHKGIFGIDAQVQYQFYSPEKTIVPYILGGIGLVAESEGDFNLQTPIGGGFQFKVAPNAYINWQSEFRYSFSEDRSNLHHGLGFVYLFGNKKDMENIEEETLEVMDKDGDGIADDEDLCPEIFGAKELNGCPDMDSDGVADYQDKCPDVAGLMKLGGCPDSDGDGVADPEDKCPEEFGLIENEGCPSMDRDNDGVLDAEDKCPDLAGPASNGGCPLEDKDNDGVPDSVDSCPDVAGSPTTNGCPDTDGDGIADNVDKCPTVYGPSVYNGCPDTDGDGIDDGRDRCPNSPGPVSTNGCPEISKKDLETLDIAMRAVQFDTGRSTLKSESFGILKQIAGIMRKYPDYNLMVSGHTDNTGSASANQKLSERRAKACAEYLTTQGISGNRIQHAGYGESRPIADNNSLRGRSLNRRVEFELVPGR